MEFVDDLQWMVPLWGFGSGKFTFVGAASLFAS